MVFEARSEWINKLNNAGLSRNFSSYICLDIAE